jgi:hypothetical protein
MDSATKRAILESMIRQTGSRFARIDFVKADGSLRTMVTQFATGAKRHREAPAASLRGQKAAQTRDENNPNLFRVWDSLAMGFRTVNLDTVKSFRFRGVETLF